MIEKTELDTHKVGVIIYYKSHNHLINIENIIFQPIPKSIKAPISSRLALGVLVKKYRKIS